MQSTKSQPKRKSDRLTKDELKELKAFVRKCINIAEASFKIGIHRNVLDNILLKGQASPESIGAVRKRLRHAA